MKIEFCEKCKEDNDRMNMGYNAHNEDCGRWQCHFLYGIDNLVFFILLIPMLFITLGAAIIFFIKDNVTRE